MHASVHDRLALEIDLQAALERDELFLEYQPTFDLAGGAIASVEALMRWRHPERGVVPPAEFIPVAESSGLILPIGRWVLRGACTQARAWHDRGHRVGVSVNISPVQLDDSGFCDVVSEALSESRLDPSTLILEITETALMRDPEVVSERLADLKRLGVRVAVDDFGTGYSSLAYLQQFPVDVLKIDRMFVSRIAASTSSRALIHTFVQLGKSLDLVTVAEGIETNDQLARLREERCEYGQGVLFARPLAPAAVQSILERLPGSRAA
jgi:EAL domain-containing protein (putative c-di-GMP-specific phosphodiesterase class I)